MKIKCIFFGRNLILKFQDSLYCLIGYLTEKIVCCRRFDGKPYGRKRCITSLGFITIPHLRCADSSS